MTDPDPARTAYWAAHFSQQAEDEDLSDTRKLDFSNDRVRFQTYGWIVESIGPVEGLHCLDAGCGTGDLARILHAMGARVDACDLAEPGIAALRARWPDIGWTVANVADLAGAPLQPGYDVIVASEVLQYVDIPDTIRSLWHLLGRGGRLIGVVPNAECPIVRRARERFEGRYAGIDVATLCALLSGLPQVEFHRWRGAVFLEDQRAIPYGLSPWAAEPQHETAMQPNRLQFVALKSD